MVKLVSIVPDAPQQVENLAALFLALGLYHPYQMLVDVNVSIASTHYIWFKSYPRFLSQLAGPQGV